MVKGEINLADCKGEIKINVWKGISHVDIELAKSFWITLSLQQAQRLKEKLEEEMSNGSKSDRT